MDTALIALVMRISALPTSVSHYFRCPCYLSKISELQAKTRIQQSFGSLKFSCSWNSLNTLSHSSRDHINGKKNDTVTQPPYFTDVLLLSVAA